MMCERRSALFVTLFLTLAIVAPSMAQQPDDIIELGPSVEEAKKIIAKQGLPQDWYQQLDEPILIGSIWGRVAFSKEVQNETLAR